MFRDSCKLDVCCVACCPYCERACLLSSLQRQDILSVICSNDQLKRTVDFAQPVVHQVRTVLRYEWSVERQPSALKLRPPAEGTDSISVFSPNLVMIGTLGFASSVQDNKGWLEKKKHRTRERCDLSLEEHSMSYSMRSSWLR